MGISLKIKICEILHRAVGQFSSPITDWAGWGFVQQALFCPEATAVRTSS